MKVPTLAFLIICICNSVSLLIIYLQYNYKLKIFQSQGGLIEKAQKAAADAALNAAIDAKNSLLDSAQEAMNEFVDKQVEMLNDIEAQITEVIMGPVQKATDIIALINEIEQGFPICIERTRDHIDSTTQNMNDDLNTCKATAFEQAANLFTGVTTSVTNFYTHTFDFTDRFKECVTDVGGSVFEVVSATACATHSTDNYRIQIGEDITNANETLRAAPGQVPEILSSASDCSVRCVSTACDELTNTVSVAESCVGINDD